MAALELNSIWKRFSGVPAVCDVSLSVASGEIVGLLGPSGCGKTTLLRIIAGLETPDSGTVRLDGADMADVPTHARDFGLMFQDYALFPHKNVFDNVAFGLRMHRRDNRAADAAITAQVHDALALVGLSGFERRSVSELSGGEAQRVALARSLAPRPRLLMLDEPLGSLDRATRERLMLELRDILTGVHVTALYVTHDQTEAFSIADRVIIMNVGRIEQVGVPETLYRRPATAFVARFLGMTNLAPGRVTAGGEVACAWGALPAATNGFEVGAEVRVLIRTEAAALPGAATALPSVSGVLTAITFRGGHYRVRLEPPGAPPLTFELSAVQPLGAQPGDTLTLALNPAGIVLLPPGGEVHTGRLK
jgi:ABC-type Fe3+/spermidine/putrescine transport system ATPase subunit